MASIKPLSDRVLVRPIEAEEKTSSGIIIPDTAKEKPQRGTVVEAGPGKVENGNKIDMSVKKEMKYFMESIPEPKLLLMEKSI